MKKNLKDQLKDHYQTKSLSVERLERLKDDLEFSRKRYRFFFRKLFPAMGVAFSILFFFNIYNTTISEKVAKEVSYNHKKNMPSEVLSSSLEVINQALDKLNFKVQASKKLAGFQVLGARYCSVQGAIAAQLHLKNIKTGMRGTLYQYKIDDKGKKANGILSLSKGVSVTMWSEGEIGYALAQESLEAH